MENGVSNAMAAWAARGLPARLDVPATARLLGFAEHDIQILMSSRKLSPLGDPAPNAPKWFAAIEVIQLAADREWLSKPLASSPNTGGTSGRGKLKPDRLTSLR
jgi:hypothetical protein